MSSIVINPLTKAELQDFINSQNHALGIVGGAGFGKAAIIGWMLRQYLPKAPADITNYPYLKYITEEKGIISIDVIRDLRKFLKLKIPGQVALQRFVVIDHADNITLPAQNALLKTLEDPPAGTLLILSLNNELSVISTIRSRLQLIHLKRPARAEVINYFVEQGHLKPEIDRAYLMSGGLVGALAGLLENEDSGIQSIVEEAKQVLKSSLFDRLAMVDGMAKDKVRCQTLFKMIIQIAQSGLETTAARGDKAAILRWQRVIDAAYQAEVSSTNNVQPKLVLTNLMLSL